MKKVISSVDETVSVSGIKNKSVVGVTLSAHQRFSSVNKFINNK